MAKPRMVAPDAIKKYNRIKDQWPLGPELTQGQKNANVTVTVKQFIHSCHVRQTMDGGDAVTISELSHLSDGTTSPSLSLVINPKRTFYLAKPSTRNYDEKREIEHISNLDKFVVENHRLGNEIYKRLNGRDTNRYVNLKELFDNPYVYGGDISVETLLKYSSQKKMQKAGKTPANITSGFFDIEKRINGEITLISYIHESHVYTAILDNAFYRFDEHGQRVKGSIEELEKFSNDILTVAIDDVLADNKNVLKASKGKLPFTFHYFVGKKEIDLIRWIFFHIHKNKTSFVGIWNMNFDLPEIIDVVKREGLELSDIFSYPGIHPGYRYANYQVDTKKTDHVADKWHWMHATSFTQFVDSMSVYSKLRTVIGKEPSYKLDDILKKNNVGSKLHFDELKDITGSATDWHRQMTEKYFYHYIVYNQFDVIAIMLMEWQNRDLQSLNLLSGVSPVAQFPKQTRKVANTLYTDWLEQGYIISPAGQNMRSEHDKEMIAQGGAVLPPTRVDKAGLYCIWENPYLRTQLHPFVNDVDFTGMYPRTCQGSNVSKETKLSTTLYIFGDAVQKRYTPQEAVEVFFSYMTNPIDNGMRIGVEFFGLPNLEDLDHLFSESLMSQDTPLLQAA